MDDLKKITEMRVWKEYAVIKVFGERPEILEGDEGKYLIIFNTNNALVLDKQRFKFSKFTELVPNPPEETH